MFRVFKYLLVFYTVSGFSFLLHPVSTRTTLTRGEDELPARIKQERQITEPEMNTDRNTAETLRRNQEYGERTGERQTPETFPASGISQKDRKTNMGKEGVTLKKPYPTERKQEVVEETEKLVAAVHLQEAKEETDEDEKMLTAKGQKEDHRRTAVKKEGIRDANQKEDLTPPLETFNQPELLLKTQTPPSSPPFIYQHVLPSPGGHSGIKLKLGDVALKTGRKDGTVRKPTETQTHTAKLTRKQNIPEKSTLFSMFTQPAEAMTVFKNLTKESNLPQKLKENIKSVKTVSLQPSATQTSGEAATVQLMENGTIHTVKHEKTSQEPQVTKTSAKLQLTTVTSPSTVPTKTNKSSKNNVMKEKQRGDNKTQKPLEKKKKKNKAPTPFPYFKDDYCPPECACYGRVVQCSDKGVQQVPYGIPYNSRYILLMNNHITSIQLDLLSEYNSMEFLTLSNNQLTDGAIEGAFEGVPALKRLYLDRNLLRSVPVDLPASLEELRLDNNHLRVMSEVAWTRCPGLLVLSLSNNSLGNESFPEDILSPLYKLRTLNLNYNQLASVPLGLPPSIKELFLRGNHIKQFCGGAFKDTSELVVLDLSANQLTNKDLLQDPLLNATHLESLNLEGNKLKQVPQHLPLSLKTLNLEGNLISSIKKAAFSTLTNLEHLGLARNKIFKVASGAFKALHILHQLDLCCNALQQAPRRLPSGLDTVVLSHNKIQSVPRDAFCWGDKSQGLSGLVRVQLEHNLINMGKLNAQAFRCLRGFQVVHFY